MASSRSFGERVRRNHALEHATLHVLARDYPDLNLVGRSDWRGFLIYGEVPTEVLERAAQEGYRRLQAGEAALSVHPRCGTNMVVTFLLTGAAVLIGLLGSQGNRRRRWPLTGLAVFGALALSAPLGPAVQRTMTTNADMTDVSLGSVTCLRQGRWATHRVEIKHKG
jgi:hypothetical protein